MTASELGTLSTQALISKYAPASWGATRFGFVAITTGGSAAPLVLTLPNLGSKGGHYTQGTTSARPTVSYYQGMPGTVSASSDYLASSAAYSSAPPATLYLVLAVTDTTPATEDGMFGSEAEAELQVYRDTSGLVHAGTNTFNEEIVSDKPLPAGVNIVTVYLDGADSWLRIGGETARKIPGTLDGDIATSDKVYFGCSASYYNTDGVALEQLVIERSLAPDEDAEILRVFTDAYEL